MSESPHVYFVGNQPKYETTTIEGPNGQIVRLIAIPKFYETGQFVLLDSDTLDTDLVQINLLDET